MLYITVPLFFFLFCLTVYLIQKMLFEGAATKEEGFTGTQTSEKEVVIGCDKLYDGFYAGVYDQLVQGQKERIPYEVEIIDSYLERLIPEKNTWNILDVGCGTADHLAEIMKLGCGSATGLDRSQAMINKARAKYPSVNINWKIGDAITTDLFAPEQFSCVCFFYFTLYYFPNRRDVFRNCYQWMRPGSVLVLHVVNRDKFDPILDSASPFPAFSLQKYSKSRVTKSGVTFEKFEYNADFDLDKENASFTEEFKFKDGTVRKQRHELYMPTMEQIVKDAEASGFRHRDYVDLKTIGYEYQYLVFLVK
jgi:SAM-dependent methyltransferase